MAISASERAFFTRLGARVAELRKVRDITQVEMAETLGVSQQTINSYEVGRRRIPVSALPALARSLGVSLEELLGEDAGGARKRGCRFRRFRRLATAVELKRFNRLRGWLVLEVSRTDLGCRRFHGLAATYLGNAREGAPLTMSGNCRQSDTFLCEDTDRGY